MSSAVLLSALLTLPAQAAPAAPAFKPHFNVRIQPPPPSPWRTIRRDTEEREIVVRKTPQDDPKIILPARETGAAVRRIEPSACQAKQPVSRK